MRMPGGGVAIVCTSGRTRIKHCRAKRPGGVVCACMAQFECDWPGCDMPLCADCAREIGPDKHLCPGHHEQPGLDFGEGEAERQLALV